MHFRMGHVGRPAANCSYASAPSIDYPLTGPTLDDSITFTRGSNGTYFDSAGVLRTAAANVPRFDYDPTALTVRGLLMESGRTNSIPNPRCEGAVVGAPGTDPTGWSISLGTTGLSKQIVGFGTDHGIPYVDYRFTAASTSASNLAVIFTPASSGGIATTASTLWSMSYFVALVGGVLPANTGCFPRFNQWDASLANLGAISPAATALPTATPLAWQRIGAAMPTLTANCAWLQPFWLFGVSAGGAADFTLRFGAPQCEVGPTVTSVILPTAGTPTASTRTQDIATIAYAKYMNDVQGSLAVSYMVPYSSLPAGTVYCSAQYDDGTTNQTYTLRAISALSANVIAFAFGSSTGTSANATIQPFVTNRHAIAYNAPARTVTSAVNGVAQPSFSMTTTPWQLNRILIGNGRTGQINGWVRHIECWPRVLTQEELNQSSLPRAASLSIDFMTPGVLDPRIVWNKTAMPATYRDATGVIRTAGGNIIGRSQDFGNVGWTKNSGNGPALPVATSAVVPAPDGTLTGSRIVFPVISTTNAWSVTYVGASVTLQPYCFSVWLRGHLGGEAIYLICANTGGSGNTVVSARLALTTSWQRYSLNITPTQPTSVNVEIGNDLRNVACASTVAQTIYAWGGQFEYGSAPGMYLMTTGNANGAPRWDWDLSGVLRGLLVEDTATNLWLQSADMNDAAWSKVGANGAGFPTMTPNPITAPDGTTLPNCCVLPPVSAASAGSYLQQIITPTAIAYTFSVYLRGVAGGERLSLRIFGDVQASTTVTLTTSWTRHTVANLLLTTTPAMFRIGVDLTDPAQTPTPGQAFYAWGAQVEAQPFATSYIPTTTATVQRARDQLSIPVANLTGYDPSRGTMYAEYMLKGAKLGFNSPVQLVGSNTGTDYISVAEVTTGANATPTTPTLSNAAVVLAAGNNAGVGYNWKVIQPNIVHRCASSWELNGYLNATFDNDRVSVPGTNNGFVTAVPTILNYTVGGLMHYQQPHSQWIRKLEYYGRALSVGEMQAKTGAA